MFDAAAQTSNPAAPAESSARERMGLLRRMSEIGLRMAERLDRQSELAALHAEGVVLPDDVRADGARRLDEMTRSFAQVSRAVSVCIALEDRIERGPPIPDPPQGGRPFGPELVCPVPRESRLKARRDQVQAGVRAAIDGDLHVGPGRVDDLCRRLDDILDREVAAVDAFLCRPADEIIARVCTRLGLEPDLDAPHSERGLPPRARPEDRDAGGTPALRERHRPSEPPGSTASQDAADPLIPCRERSLPVRAGQGRAPWARREAAGRRPDLEQPEPASKIACMGSRTVRGGSP